METYQQWDPDKVYAKGERTVHNERLYVAAESVVAIEPDPGSGFDHWPWVYLGWHSVRETSPPTAPGA